MINIIAKNKVKIEEVENFKELAKELILKSKAEKGCISYDLYEDINEPNILAFIEIWKDKESIEKHNESAHFKKIVPKLGKLVEGEKDVRIYKKA